MSYITEQIGGKRVCDATAALFLQQKKRVFCSNVRFWSFSASKCAMRLLQQTGGGDAGCAYLRKGDKRAVSRPMMPHDGTPCRGVTPGDGAIFRGRYSGKFYGEKCGAITQQNQTH